MNARLQYIRRVRPTLVLAAAVLLAGCGNQSTAAQTVTFETDEIGGESGGITRSTPEIAARSTGQLKVDPPEGTYRLSASSSSIRPAAIEVGVRRESAQNELLQP